MNPLTIQAFAAKHGNMCRTSSVLVAFVCVGLLTTVLMSVSAGKTLAQKLPDPVAPAAKPAATTAPAATSVKAATTPAPSAMPAKDATKPEPAKSEAKGSVVSNDDAIAAAIKEKLSKTPSLKDAGLNVEVKEGVATLTGTLAKPQLKGVATRVVKSVAGVKSVTNNITVPKNQ